MSRSPTGKSTAADRDAYARAWAALQRLLRHGKSESGQERNCCFLNLGGSADSSHGRFATVSAATGLDFPDDGRGQALCDWDYDGRIDFWTTNRTAPRARCLLNRYPSSQNRWLALRLEGDGRSVNRDAIGARIEIQPSGLPAGQAPLLRTVSAGTGFLSQSTLWQHVGLGTAAAIDRVVVRWPGGPVEAFAGVTVDGFFVLKQGSGTAIRWTPPPATAVAGSDFARADLPDDADRDVRTVLLAPLALPADWLPAKPGPGGLLINLWSIDCLNCAAELREWAPHVAEWEKSGVPLFSWCVDADGAKADAKARSLGWKSGVHGMPSRTTGKKGSGKAGVDNVSANAAGLPAVYNALQMAVSGLQRDLPVPATLLIDPLGRLVAIFKGPASAEAIGASLPLTSATFLQRLAVGSPENDGQWFEPIAGTGSVFAAASLIDEGLADRAPAILDGSIRYYGDLLAGKAPALAVAEAMPMPWVKKETADAHRTLGKILVDSRKFAEAEAHLLRAHELQPGHVSHQALADLYLAMKSPAVFPKLGEHLEALVASNRDPVSVGQLGVLHLEVGRPREAIPLLKESLGRQRDAMLAFQLGQAHHRLGERAEAAAAWQAAIETEPNLAPALNNLAWIKATASEDNLRDGAEAVRLARAAVAAGKPPKPALLGTLAVALAEAGDFQAAVATAREARAAAVAAKDQSLIAKLDGWLQSFAQKHPIREP